MLLLLGCHCFRSISPTFSSSYLSFFLAIVSFSSFAASTGAPSVSIYAQRGPCVSFFESLVLLSEGDPLRFHVSLYYKVPPPPLFACVSSVAADTTATPLEDFTIDWQTDEFTSPKLEKKEKKKYITEIHDIEENGRHTKCQTKKFQTNYCAHRIGPT